MKKRVNYSDYSQVRSQGIRKKSDSHYSIQDYKISKYRKIHDSIKYDIENFQMIDQPNYDGIDSKITLWCT